MGLIESFEDKFMREKEEKKHNLKYNVQSPHHPM